MIHDSGSLSIYINNISTITDTTCWHFVDIFSWYFVSHNMVYRYMYIYLLWMQSTEIFEMPCSRILPNKWLSTWHNLFWFAWTLLGHKCITYHQKGSIHTLSFLWHRPTHLNMWVLAPTGLNVVLLHLFIWLLWSGWPSNSFSQDFDNLQWNHIENGGQN